MGLAKWINVDPHLVNYSTYEPTRTITLSVYNKFPCDILFIGTALRSDNVMFAH